MARGTVLWSDKSGAQIGPNTGARVRVAFYAAERLDMRADLTDEEVEKLIREYKFKEVEARPTRRGEKRVRL
ncbi:MAG: hypothetical protein KGL39_29840 [Patescibacteria group bacterium]|nr:hypothetical protein [Patescibacteria group bacterium]